MQIFCLDCPENRWLLEEAQEVEEDWAHQQQQDPDLCQLSGWFERGFPPTAQEMENISIGLQRWLREWSRLEKRGGVLWRKRVQQGTGEHFQQVKVCPLYHNREDRPCGTNTIDKLGMPTQTRPLPSYVNGTSGREWLRTVPPGAKSVDCASPTNLDQR